MRRLGIALFLFGFLASAFVIVRHVDRVEWSSYAITMLIAVIGVVMMRLTAKRGSAESEVHVANLKTIVESLENLTQKLAAWIEERERVDVYSVHGRIDDELMVELDRFVTSREALIHEFGLETYARVMDAFAAGERAVNRAWCASADGYIDEVWTTLERAHRRMEAALQIVRSA